LLKQWVSFGLAPDYFWQITPREMEIIMDGAQEKISRDQLSLDRLSWHIGQLNAIGFHNPKAYPKYEKFIGKNPLGSDKDDQEKMKAAMQGWASSQKKAR
jgi:hypothetical protein